MCRQSQNPALGSWAIPGGFLEYGETLQQGAARETFEETRVLIKPDALQLYAVMSMTAIHQVIASFRIKLAAKPELRCGPECLELAFMSEEEMPTSSLAWGEEMGDGPQRFFAELRSGQFCIHLMSIGFEGQPFHNCAYKLRRARPLR
jgi:ADP-ribose pyrophosphatase YjhB (NUDIX family)